MPAQGRERLSRIIVINPNTNAATTRSMVDLAQERAGPSVHVEGRTAPFGAGFIIDEAGLSLSVDAVKEMVAELAAEAAPGTGVIVAAFGDPGLDWARDAFPGPVCGIGEASLLAAAACAAAFSVVTTTSGLDAGIERSARALGLDKQLRSVRLTATHPSELADDPQKLAAELREAAEQAVRLDGAQAVVIGGGPLARFAEEIARGLPVPVLEPVSVAVDRLVDGGLSAAN